MSDPEILTGTQNSCRRILFSQCCAPVCLQSWDFVCRKKWWRDSRALNADYLHSLVQNIQRKVLFLAQPKTATLALLVCCFIQLASDTAPATWCSSPLLLAIGAMLLQQHHFERLLHLHWHVNLAANKLCHLERCTCILQSAHPCSLNSTSVEEAINWRQLMSFKFVLIRMKICLGQCSRLPIILRGCALGIRLNFCCSLKAASSAEPQLLHCFLEVSLAILGAPV